MLATQPPAKHASDLRSAVRNEGRKALPQGCAAESPSPLLDVNVLGEKTSNK